MAALNAQQLEDLLTEGRSFRSELHRWQMVERAEAETDQGKRLERMQAVVEADMLWRPKGATRGQIEALFAMIREIHRISMATASKDFRRKYGIELTCGDAE